METEHVCACLLCVESVGGVGWASHHLGWCRAGVHSSSGVTAEEAATTNISSPGGLCSPVHNDRLHGGGLSGGKEQHLDTRNIVGDTVATQRTNRHTTYLYKYFSKRQNIFFVPDPLLLGGLMTWQPSSARPQVPGTGATREQEAISI